MYEMTKHSPRRVASPRAGFTVLDLFAGAGGLSEGFRQAGFSIVAGMDNDPDATAMYALNFPRGAGDHRGSACAWDPRAGVGCGQVRICPGRRAAVPGVFPDAQPHAHDR